LFGIENYFYAFHDVFRATATARSKFQTLVFFGLILVLLLFHFSFISRNWPPMTFFMPFSTMPAASYPAADDRVLDNYLSNLHEIALRKTEALNVIIIVVDSLRADYMLSSLVYSRLMSQCPSGSYFSVDQFFSQSSESVAALSSLMSGRLPFKLPELSRAFLIQDIFKESGYVTGFFNSTKNEWHERAALTQHGFDIFFDIEIPGGANNDTQTMTQLLSWVSSCRDKPFFGLLILNATHAYYRLQRQRDPLLLGMDPEDKNIQTYKDAVASVLEQVESLLIFLRQSHLQKRTVVVLTGDHGELFGEHDLYFHANSLYPEVLRVPLIVFAGAGEISQADYPWGSQIDILPTILNLSGLPVPPEVDGTDILCHRSKDDYKVVTWLDVAKQFGIFTPEGQYTLNLLRNEDAFLPYPELHKTAGDSLLLRSRLREYFDKNIYPYFYDGEHKRF
jgi:membrane-anchored protein YejM (alkaline phosphatase superfamily)